MTRTTLIACALLVALVGGGCKKRVKTDPTAVNMESFNLGLAVGLLQANKVKSGKDFEKAVNARNISRVDVDHDGRPDPIQVVESRKGDRRELALRAIPTSAKGQPADDVAVPVADIKFTPDRDAQALKVEAAYAPVVRGGPPVAFTVPAVWQGDVVVFQPTSFFYWLLVVDRPIFIGTYWAEVIVIDAPPPHIHYGKFKHKHK